METIYVLQEGEYHRCRNIMVTTNVKDIASAYVKSVEEGISSGHSNSPFIEIWNAETNKDGYPVQFGDFERNEQRLVKCLSKLARGL